MSKAEKMFNDLNYKRAKGVDKILIVFEKEEEIRPNVFDRTEFVFDLLMCEWHSERTTTQKYDKGYSTIERKKVLHTVKEHEAVTQQMKEVKWI